MKEHGTGSNLALWIVASVVAALFFAAGGAKIGGWFDQRFVAWGYSPGFAVLIGVFEVLFAIALLFERTAAWAAFGLMAIMLGAIGTHLTHGEYALLILPVSVILLLGVIAWGRGSERSPARSSEPRSPQPAASRP
jgi:putative oxidoreductase